MKLCSNCGQAVAEEIATCPSCGRDVGQGRSHIDDYRIEDIVHEGYASILCRAVHERTGEQVMIRLFTPWSRVDEKVAGRLREELEELKKLPAEGFVRHHSIQRSTDGLWYRISEWVEAESWGDLIASGRLKDFRVAFALFTKIASILEMLHKEGHFIPHLILDDIIVIEAEDGELEVKIDYKLSRFFDPALDRPGPTLKRLLECHPDIVNQRPLDFRSDIWSLGKIFVEILTADFERCDFAARLDALDLPRQAGILFKTMLADDPDLRPQSMAEAAQALAGIGEAEIEEAKRRHREMAVAPAREIRRLKRRQRLLIAGVVCLAVIGLLTWFQWGGQKKDDATLLGEYANQYAPSVAFVLVEYWLTTDETTVYRSRAEGTAFLVDEAGYLLTNRHVACPWLEDQTLFLAVTRLRMSNRAPRFGYRMFLWFEGAKAFNRLAGLMDGAELEDAYFLDSAFRSDGTPLLTIAGVAKPPVETREVVASPLGNDLAVLKISHLPAGLKPLPLDGDLEARSVPKLSPIIALGFPLGSRSQEARVNVSVTQGHVRRSFENLLQIDASLYGGNSGGPIIDRRGLVIGIASGVATTRSPGPLPVPTPLWDIGLVLPITPALDCLEALKAGQTKWNGVLDLSVKEKLAWIVEAAQEGRWAEAKNRADEELKLSQDPALTMAGGMMHFCAGDDLGARRLFSRSLSMDPSNRLASLMLYLLDWRAGRSRSSALREGLLALDWRSPAEFLGHLVRVLEGVVDEEPALKSAESKAEQSWLNYVVGLIKTRDGRWVEAEERLRQAVLEAETDAWHYFLARAHLERVQKERAASFLTEAQQSEYEAEVEAFERAEQESRTAKDERREGLALPRAKLAAHSTSLEEKRQILERIRQTDPPGSRILARLVFLSAMAEDWPQALEYIRTLTATQGRESAIRLSAGLLEGQILHFLGRDEGARTSLEAYLRRTSDPLHRAVSECLLGQRTEESVLAEAGESPENLITVHTALGFWAEGSGQPEKAIKHYRIALESYLDTWLEYQFAWERLTRLRRAEG